MRYPTREGKRCPGCKENRSASEYSGNASRPDRLSAYCRACGAAQSKAYRNKYPERFSEMQKRWRAREWEYDRARKMKWAKENKAKVRAAFAAHEIIRSARRRCAEGTFNEADLLLIRARQGDKCAYCEISLDCGGTLDHKQPLARGGTNWPENLAWACRSCNSQKWARNPEEFLALRKSRGL